MEDLTPTKSPFDATIIIFKSLTKIAAAFLSLAGFAYIIGWFQASSYFNTLGADWILNDMNTMSILSYSWIPIVVLLGFLYLGLWDISQNRLKKIKHDRVLRKYLILFIILLIIGRFVLQRLELDIYYKPITYILIWSYFFYAGISLQTLITELQNRSFKWNTFANALIYGVVVFGLYWAPYMIGEVNAKSDMDIKSSPLPKVILKTVSNNDLRLLYNTQDRFYLVELSDSLKYPFVFVASIDEIEKVRKN